VLRLGVRESTRPVKIERWGVGVVICVERGADCLHTVQLVPLCSRSSAVQAERPRSSATARTGCRRGAVVSGVRRMNEVNARRARLILGWVTVFGRVYHLGT